MLYAPFEVLVILWGRSIGGLLLYLCACYFALLFWDLFVWMQFAVGRKMTLNEVRNIWKYKYCFAVRVTKEDKSMFVHK